MKKGVVLISILVIAIFLSGCGKTNTNTQNTSSTGKAYVGGTDGLAISFVENSPPKEVFDNKQGDFSISVKVENKGEFDAVGTKYKLTLTGLDFKAFGATDAQLLTIKDATKPDKLEKVRRSVGEVIPGTFVFFDFTGIKFTYQYPVNGQIGPFNLRAGLCYAYQTEASSKICMLQDLYGRSGRVGLCKAIEDKTVENSGAPVIVESFKESVVGNNKVALSFVIKQKGDSKDVVFEPGSQICNMTNLNEQSRVKVNVTVGTTALAIADCAGLNVDGKATLYGDKGTEIRCTYTETSPSDRELPVKITLNYDYYEYADAPITVRQLGS